VTAARRLGPDGRWVVVAVDHPLYSWPCRGLEDRAGLIRRVCDAGADAIIASYGTIRDAREAFRTAEPILKLDLTTVSLGGDYPISEFVAAWDPGDARRLGVQYVLTYVQLGAPFELKALRAAAQTAAAADAAGLAYVCEIMPVEGERFPNPAAPQAIAAAVRVGAELGAHIVKTTLPDPPEGLAEAPTGEVPVLVAGGGLVEDREGLLETVRRAVAAGAAGVAFGRNVWESPDPEAMVTSLRDIVHAGRSSGATESSARRGSRDA
jgi:DhnA family fructose-bisphosphate aldolase class Ia